ncbi:ABC transporter ATP-binding protein/permease [Priestia megaterium]|uniref:ABC transporter ATP-binding protein n=1 Tax=Priestia megaterium TaxID=1404 RepID=UPI0022827F1B|nr:ABC transporter ATP-binding protein [Priestia megaterium]MCY9026860.1 ABC transporter ATP-binding protein/permease [Priestia megaterium]
MKEVKYFLTKLHNFAGNILYINLLGMVLVSFLEGAGIFLLVPMLGSSGILDISAKSSANQNVIKILEVFPITLSLTLILSLYVFIVASVAFLQRYVTIQNAKIQIGFINFLRLETHNALLTANWIFLARKRKSDLINLLTGELGRVSMGTNLCLQLLTSTIFTFIQVCFALWLSIKMTLFILLCGIILVFLTRKFTKRAKVLGGRTSEISQNYLGGITDQFNGIKDIKSNNLEDSRIEWLEEWSKSIEHEQIEYIKLKTGSQLYYKISLGILITIFISVSINIFHRQAIQLILIILIFSRLWPRFISIQSNLEQLASSIPALNRLIELQDECKRFNELKTSKDKRIRSLAITEEIACKNVYFRYDKTSSVFNLENINLKIPLNCTTAIVGYSGAGKSTLVDILMGLIEPDKGEVSLDGSPLKREDLTAFRKAISYVPQDPFLFNGSIRDNFLIMKPNARDEDIWESLEFAASKEFVQNLPEGLDTIVGDRGVKLSGGERQRIVLARSILRKPSILVLDEATSALDMENEAKIQESLKKIKGEITIVIVAHRLSTIKNADQVIVMDKGKIIQNGQFNQLAQERGGILDRLLEKQRELQYIHGHG